MKHFAKLVTFISLLTINCLASTYSVDVIDSSSKETSFTVTVNGCVTSFRVKIKDLEKVSESESAMDQIIKLAVARAKSGCKSNK